MTRKTFLYVAQALRAAAVVLAGAKRLRVFDMDDTLVSSDGVITVTKANGESVKMNSGTFAHYKPSHGDKLDFGGFNHITNPHIIKKNFERLKKAASSTSADAVILTARSKGSESAITKFLKREGIKNVKVVALASSDPNDKARWIDKAVQENGYKDVEFHDDSKANTKAVHDWGAKHHRDIRWKSFTAPHPGDTDYEGDVIKETFESDDPTAAVVDYKAKTEEDQKKPPSEWWKDQTKEFKKRYCDEHENSHLCQDQGMNAAVLTAGDDDEKKDPNSARKKQVAKRQAKIRNQKVDKYLKNDFFPKMDQMGPMAGAWIENLESDFDSLTKEPDGLLKKFDDKDFNDLFLALFGYKREG